MIEPTAAYIRRSATAAALLIAAGLAVGCSNSGDENDQVPANDLPAAELFNRIEDARELRPGEEPPRERIGTLTDNEVPQDLRGGPSCRLTRGGALLLVAAAGGAAARIDGRPIRFQIAGVVGPSGGFFRASGVTISVGRQVPPPGDGPEPPAPATATIASTGKGDDPRPQKIAGIWGCSTAPATAAPAPAAQN